MTSPLRVLIVDDEPLARARLQRLLRDEPQIDLLGECATGLDAAEAITALRPDVVFLDIQMPELDGFGVVRRSAESSDGLQAAPLIVFVTAYAEHAVRAFDERALDYLLKPVSAHRLRESVARARERLSVSTDHQARELVQNLLDAVRPGARLAAAGTGGSGGRRPSRFAVPIGSRLRFIAPGEIDYITAEANYVGLHVAGRSLMLRETMHAVEARLDPAEFLRIHRSRIVRIDRITDIEPLASGQYVVRLKDGTRLTSGRSYRARLQATLGVGFGAARDRDRDRDGAVVAAAGAGAAAAAAGAGVGASVAAGAGARSAPS